MSTQRDEELQQIIDESYVEAVNEFMNTVAQYLAGSISVSVASISFESINLEALANALGVFGWTDPIGEIKQWFYDRLKEISTFFSDIVKSIITPVKNVVDSIWDFLQGIPDKVVGGIKSFIDALSSAVSSIADTLSNYFNQIIGQISNVISSISSALSNAATSIVNTLSNALSSIGSALQNLMTDLLNKIMSGLQIIGSALSDVFSKISSALADAISGALNAIKSFFQSIGDTLSHIWQDIINNLSKVGSMISEGIQSGLKWLWDSIQGVVGKIWEGIQTFGKVLADSFGKVWEWIQSGVQWLWNTIQGILSRIWEGLVSFGQAVANFFGQVWNWIQSGIQWIWQQLQGFGSWLWGLIQQGLQWLWNTLTSIGSKIWEGLQWVWNILTDAVSKLWGWIWNGLQWVWQQLTNVGQMIWNGLVNFWNTLSGVFTKIWEGITGVGQWIWNGILQFSELVQRVFQDIGNRVMGALSTVGSALSNFGKMLVDGFTTVTRMVTDFAKIFDKWATALMGGLSSLGNAFNQFLQSIANLPQTLQNMFKGVIDFFTKLGEGLSEFIRSPFEFLRKHIIEPIWSGLQWLAEKIWEGLQWIGQKIVEGFNWLWERLKEIGVAIINIFKDIGSTLINGIIGLAESFRAIGESVVNFILGLLDKIRQGLSNVFQGVFKPVVTEFMKAVGWGTPPGLTPDNFVGAALTSFAWSFIFMDLAFKLSIPIRSITYAMRGIARQLGNLNAATTFLINVFGLGLQVTIDIFKSIGVVLWNLADDVDKFAERLFEPAWRGLIGWYRRFVDLFFVYQLRNFVPIAMPPLEMSVNMWNRLEATTLTTYKIPESQLGSVDSAKEVIMNFLKMRGYSDYLLSMIFTKEDEFYIQIKDRFGTDRKIPLGSAWRLPPARDIVVMMIRDLFNNVNDFKAVMRAHGFNEDVATLYFFYHFRYPRAQDLARFFWRGVAQVLWFPDSLEESDIKSQLKVQYSASAPKDLNGKFDKLKTALNKYLKWYDYAPFAWVDGFTTDKAIMAELMADLPTRIEVRWMLRWGILEHLSKLGFTITSQIDTMVNVMKSASGQEMLAKQVSASITMDLSQVVRLLVARGMHPYFAIAIAVAEAHTALTPEITLLRTGMLNLYRYGVTDLTLLEQLMSGLFTIEFTLAQLDLNSGSWSTFTYRKPIFWLPAERRLLQLRSVMDRYTTLWRMFLREIERGVRTLLILSKDDIQAISSYIDSLKLPPELSGKLQSLKTELSNVKTYDDLIDEFYNKIKERLKSEVKAVSGQEIEFARDQAYIDMWMEYAKLVRSVEAKRWVRTFATRMMGWLLYRVSYAWMTPEEFSVLTASLLARGWISIEEKEFLDTVAEWIHGIVKKELIPSPQTLATFAEYMKVPDDVIEKVLDAYRVPEEFRQLYKQYIAYRFVKSDYRTYINRARRAYVLGIISDAEWSKILSDAIEKYGFRQEEIEIMQKIAELEELMNDVRAWRPSLTTIATISEVVPIPDDVMNKIFDKFRIDPLIAPYIKTYIKRKPLVDELRSIINEYYRLKYYAGIYKQQIPADIEQAVQNYMKLFGLTDEEKAIRNLTVVMRELAEEWRENAREYIPTPSMLATISEYVPSITDEMINKVLDARRVPQEWRDIWRQYIKARALADEVRSLLSAFYRMKRYAMLYGYVVPKDVEDVVMKYAKIIGITDEEKNIRDLIAQIEATVDNWRELARRGETIPTLAQLVTMAEYINVPIDYVKKVLDARRVDPTYANLWLQYLSARTIATEVNRVVRAFEDLYVRFGVPEEIVKQVISLMAQGGWTEQELKIFGFELELRRTYRVLMLLVPTIRQFITDAQYLPNYDTLFQDLLQAYAIDVEKYKKQVEYYKRLLKNRRLWRHFAWYRTQLTYAYMYGYMDENQIRQKLQQFVNIGLLDPDEVEIIIDGIKIRAGAYAAYLAIRYGYSAL